MGMIAPIDFWLNGWSLLSDAGTATIGVTPSAAQTVSDSGTCTFGIGVGDSTPVIDEFNAGANQNVSAREGWASPIWSGEGTLVTDVVPTYAASASGFGSNYRPGTLTDCEAWATFSAYGASTEIDLYTRLTSLNTAVVNGYGLNITPATGRMRLLPWTNGVQGAPLIDQTPAVAGIGDSYKIKSVGSTHELWRKPSGGAWGLVGSAVSTAFASGVIGIEMNVGAHVDAFGGGSLVSSVGTIVDSGTCSFGITTGETTGVLDDFNAGALQSLTTRPGWGTTGYWAGEPSMRVNVTADAAEVANLAAWQSNYWAGALGDSEVWVRIGALGGAAPRAVIVSTRGSGMNGSPSDYELYCNLSDGSWALDRYDAGVVAHLSTGSFGGVLLSTGDSFKLRSVGDKHTVWFKPVAGAWTLIATFTDATYASGVLGLQTFYTTSSGSIDAFGGGGVATAPGETIVDAGKCTFTVATGTATVLDSFNFGPSQSLNVRPGWASPAHFSSEPGYSTNGTPDQAVKDVPGNWSSMVWGGSPPLAGNAWFTLKTTPTGSEFYYYFGAFYMIGYADGHGFELHETIATVDTIIAGPVSISGGAMLAGDSVRARFDAGSVAVDYRRAGGAWTQILSATPTHSGAYGPALETGSNFDSGIDEFGGGPTTSIGETLTDSGTCTMGLGGPSLAPATPALDQFNAGANQDLVAASRAGWAATPIFNFNLPLKTDSVPTYANSPGNLNDAAWGTSLPADQEVWFTVSAYALAGDNDLYARMNVLNTSGTTLTCYQLKRANPGTVWQIRKSVVGTITALSAGFSQALSAGDSIALTCDGTRISSWYRPSGGAWTLMESVLDASVTGGGYIGIDAYDANMHFDAIGGGARGSVGGTIVDSGTCSFGITPSVGKGYLASGPLDDFNNVPNQNLVLRSGWHANEIWSGDSTFATDSVPSYAIGTAAAADNAWGASIAADQDVWGTLRTLAGFDLYVRMPAPDPFVGATSGYALNYNHGTGAWKFFDSLFTGQIGSTATQALSPGDSVRFSVVAGTLTGWYRAAGTTTWTPVLTATDSRFTGSGYIGFDTGAGTTISFDTFGGGALVPVESVSDAGTCTAVFSFTASESLVGGSISDSGTVTFAVAPSGLETISDAGTCTIGVVPSATERLNDSGSISLSLSQTAAETFSDASTQNVVLAPTGAETLGDSATCALSVTPTSVETFSDATSTTLVLAPTYAFIWPDSGTCTFVVLPSASEQVQDTATVIFVLTEADSERESDQGTVPVILTPSAAESIVDSGSQSAVITPSATETESDAGTQPGVLSQTAAETYIVADSVFVTITPSETGIEQGNALVVVDGTATETISDAGTATMSIASTDVEQIQAADALVFVITPTQVEGPVDSGTCMAVLPQTAVETQVDAATVTIILSETAVERSVDAGSVTLVLAQSAAEQTQDAGSVPVALTQTEFDAAGEAGTCTLALVVSATEQMQDAGTATLVFPETAVERDTDAGTASFALVATATETVTDSGTVVIVLSETAVETPIWADAGTATIAFSPSAAETLRDANSVSYALTFAGGEAFIQASTQTVVLSQSYLRVAPGGGASTPNNAALVVGTGVLDLRWEGTLDAWNNGAWQGLITQYLSGGVAGSRFWLGIDPGGGLEYDFLNTSGTWVVVFCTAPGFPDGGKGYLRLVHDVAAGTVDFYKSVDGLTWVPLQAQVTGLSTLGQATSGPVAAVTVSTDFGNEYAAGKTYQSHVLVNGVPAVSIDWRTMKSGAGTWVGAAGETWTAIGASAVVAAAESATETTIDGGTCSFTLVPTTTVAQPLEAGTATFSMSQTAVETIVGATPATQTVVLTPTYFGGAPGAAGNQTITLSQTAVETIVGDPTAGTCTIVMVPSHVWTAGFDPHEPSALYGSDAPERRRHRADVARANAMKAGDPQHRDRKLVRR